MWLEDSPGGQWATGKVEAGEDTKRPRGHQCYRNVYYKDKYIQLWDIKTTDPGPVGLQGMQRVEGGGKARLGRMVGQGGPVVDPQPWALGAAWE